MPISTSSGIQQVAQDFRAVHDLRGAFAHQHVVAGDVGFAFGAVEDQGVDLLLADTQLDVAGEYRAAQADDTGHAQQLRNSSGAWLR